MNPSDKKPEHEEEAQREQEKASEDLTPEEQMALYEESLKESDWGHQPC
jgi:hypothetical protein